jgi:hypothetical protein
VVPSGIRPLPWVARTAWHRLVLPDLQNLHSPHSAVYSGITWSPTLRASHAFADRLDDAAAFVAEDGRGNAFRVVAGQREGIGVANAGGDDAHQHLAGLRRFDINFNDLQRLVGGKGNGGAGFDRHGRPLPAAD